MIVKETEEVTLTKHSNGVIEVLKHIVYTKPSGEELSRELPWRRCLIPGDFESAAECLSEYEMNIVREVWTDEVIITYQEQHKDDQFN